MFETSFKVHSHDIEPLENRLMKEMFGEESPKQ